MPDRVIVEEAAPPVSPSILSAYVDACRARGLSPGTIAVYRREVGAFIAWWEATTGQAFDPRAVTSLDVADWRRQVAQTHSTSSVNHRLRSVRSFFAWCVRVGYASTNPAADVRSLPEQTPPVRALSRQEVGRLLRVVERYGGPYDVALVTLLLQTGVRISEALALRRADVTIRERSGFIDVRGKGGKTRRIPLTITARRALARILPPLPDDYLWRGRRPGRPLTARVVQARLRQFGRLAGLDHVTPHALRHTALKTLVDAGVPLDRVALLAGHASLSTTARYTRATEGDLERAISALDWT